MIWLVWRRQRATLLTSAGLVVVLAVVLVAGRLAFVAHLRQRGIDDTCFDTLSEACRRNVRAVLFADHEPSEFAWFWGPGRAALVAAPLVIGLFSGAGLFRREFDESTYALAPTQSITATRWWATSLLVAGAPSTVLPVVLGLVADWAYGPFDLVTSSFGDLETPKFEISGIVPGAYALLAFALAACTGLVSRSTLPPFVVAGAAYSTLMLALATIARPHYLPPETVQQWINPARQDGGLDDFADAWQLDSQWIDDQGRTRLTVGCAASADLYRCMHDSGIVRRDVRLQPDSRFWLFQVIETSILLALSAVVLRAGWPRVTRSVASQTPADEG
jgi:hypothetical protein